MNIEKLSPLLGKWSGAGTAKFPTIKTTNYLEDLEFLLTGKKHVLFYQQKTYYMVTSPLGRRGVKGDPLHLESGYITAHEDGTFELSNSQDNGRVEVLKGNIIKNYRKYFHISFTSKFIGNDDRMLNTVREFIIEGNTLKYIMKMATKKTPELQEHLEAELVKV